MIKPSTCLWMLLAVIMTASSTHAANDRSYLQSGEIPNPLVYLPVPPDSSMLTTNGDYAWWIWGKQQRNTPRGEQASKDSKYGIVRMCAIYSGLLGINISPDYTPAIYRLMYKAGETGAAAVVLMKTSYFRKRPFVVMNEATWGQYDTLDELGNSSAYPSSHTACGWGTALALAEMAPHLQDTILRRGYEYGISRVIVGAHWRSDVDAAITCASAAIARAHATLDYALDMEAAKQEYMTITGLTEAQIGNNSSPSLARVLDPPPFEDSYHFYGDVSPYWKAKGERNGPRGDQAITDASLNDNDIINGFALSAGISLSSSSTPRISSLISTLKLMLGLYAFSMKDVWHRNRPYVQLGDTTAVPADEDTYLNESSYPSGHAMIGWGIALALAEVMPDRQDAILKRGYDFGWSRVIAGYHYPSDVQAGRVMAACFLAKIHGDATFSNMLELAKQEYANLTQ